MRGIVRSLGTVSLVLLFFGGAAWAITREFSAFVGVNLVLGVFSLITYLASGGENLRAFIGERSTRYGVNAIVYSILFVLVVAMGNFVAARNNKRFDATEAKVYSLSPQSSEIVRGLENDLEMMAFVEGGSDPALEDLFRSYAAESSHVKWQLVDPDQTPDLAERYKITEYNTVRVAYGEQSTVVSRPNEEVITNAVRKVVNPAKKNVCFVEGHGEPDIEEIENARGFNGLKTALENENYVVKKILLATMEKAPTADECSTIVFSVPEKQYLAPEVERAREYLKAGGPAFFFFTAGKSAELAPLAADFGVKVGNDVVVDQVIRLFEGPTLGLSPVANTYDAHPITENLKERTVFPLVRSVETSADGKPGIEAASLVKTSRQSWAESDVDGVFQRGEAALDPTADKKGPVSIAAAVKTDLKQAGVGENGESRIVVFGSEQFANNKNINTYFNRDLVVNAISWTAGEEKGLTIRPRTVRASRVAGMEEDAYWIFYVSVLLLPELLLLAGIVVWARRRGA